MMVFLRQTSLIYGTDEALYQCPSSSRQQADSFIMLPRAILMTSCNAGTGLRVEEQNWETLVLHAWPRNTEATSVTRAVHERGDPAWRTELTFATDGNGKATLEIGKHENGSSRGWILRLHLKSGERVRSVAVDGMPLDLSLVSVVPSSTASPSAAAYFPFQGVGHSAAARAGDIVEVPIKPGSKARVVEVQIE